MCPLNFSKEVPSFKKDFAPYVKLVSFSSTPSADDILKAFQNSQSRLSKANQIVIAGLILTFPSVTKQQVTQLPDAMKKVVEHCEANSNTVDESYLKEAHRLLRQLASEFNRRALGLTLVDPRAEQAAQHLKPALNQLSETTLNQWLNSILNLLSKKLPEYAQSQSEAHYLNLEAFSEPEADLASGTHQCVA